MTEQEFDELCDLLAEMIFDKMRKDAAAEAASGWQQCENKMAKRNQSDTKVMYEEAIRQNIAKKDGQKLSEVIIGAVKGSMSRRGTTKHVTEDC